MALSALRGALQVGHLLVPFRRRSAAQVWPRQEELLAAHVDLRLEDAGDVGVVVVRHAAIDEER